MNYHKTFFYILVALLSVFTTVSCCRTCLIANSELSDINTGAYKKWKNVTTITSNTKSAKILPENGGQVLSYSIDGVNIFSSPSNTRIYLEKSSLDTDFDIQKSKYQLFKPDSILFSNIFVQSSYLKYIKKFSMNLNNGDLNITQYFKNNSDKEKLLLTDNIVSFKKGGYFIVPANIISELSNDWIDLYNGKKQDLSNCIKIYNDKIFIKTIDVQFKVGIDNISGWYAYAYKNLLFVVKFPRKGKSDYIDKLSLILDSTSEKVTANIPSPINHLTSGHEYIFSQKWSIIKLDKSVNSFEDAYNIFKRLHISLILNR